MFSNGRGIPPRKRTAYRAHEVCFLELYFSILERFLNILHKNKFLWFLSCNPHTSELELQLKKTSILTKNFEFFFEKRFLWSIFASNQQSKQTHLVKNDNVMATNIFIIFLPIHILKNIKVVDMSVKLKFGWSLEFSERTFEKTYLDKFCETYKLKQY